MFFVALLNGKLSTTEIIRCFKVTHSGIYHSFLSNSQWNSPCLPVFYCVWFCHVMEFVLSSINLTLLVIILTNVNFLLTISIHGQDVRL